LASVRNCRSSYGTPVQVWVLSKPRTVVFPSASRRVASIAISAARASGAAPPNMPECISEPSARTVTTTLARPRSEVVTVGRPSVALPVSQTRIVSARSRSGSVGT
jgi:hypothetical protein